MLGMGRGNLAELHEGGSEVLQNVDCHRWRESIAVVIFFENGDNLLAMLGVVNFVFGKGTAPVATIL